MIENKFVEKLINLALEEDCVFEDITSRLTINNNQCQAGILAKEDFVLCGIELIEIIKKISKFEFSIKLNFKDGDFVRNKDVIAILEGPAITILALERTILNFLQRLSGVATYTNKLVKQAKNFTILDTRKTTPGFRYLEKYAVKIGGGDNHRMSLADMVLVKDNHIDTNNGDISLTLEKIYKSKPSNIPVEVEVRNKEELLKVFKFPVDQIMLDNMSDKEILECVPLIRKNLPNSKIEISGGLTLNRFSFLSEAGIDFISLGSLTTQSTNVDISMKINIFHA